MVNHIEYVFDTEPMAYRFLNTVSNWDVTGLKVRFGQSAHHVRIEYQVQTSGFDTTLSELDDLASKEGGSEVG